MNDRQYTVNEDGTIEQEVTILNKRGLHARADEGLDACPGVVIAARDRAAEFAGDRRHGLRRRQAGVGQVHTGGAPGQPGLDHLAEGGAPDPAFADQLENPIPMLESVHERLEDRAALRALEEGFRLRDVAKGRDAKTEIGAVHDYSDVAGLSNCCIRL